MTRFDAIVAGAGIWGCTVARRLAEVGKKVLVLEKRTAVGGNCSCEIDAETGIEVHTYGSHIFHTSNEAVWQFVRRFTEFNDYRHCVLARTRRSPSSESKSKNGDYHSLNSTSNFDSIPTYHLPIGCTLLKEFFGREIKPSEMTDAERMAVFDAFIRGYTSKQWGLPPEKVDPSIIARLKVRDNASTDYFDDPHQGVPTNGYNKMFKHMLDHQNITVECGREFVLPCKGGDVEMAKNLPCSPWLKIYYSGPIDALFNYKFGALPWRTLRFERETLPIADYQGNSVVNYTDAEDPFTRIHEFKHYHPEKVEVKAEGEQRKFTSKWGFDAPKTVIMREYSATWQPGDEPYYPINTPESAALLTRYREEVEIVNHHCSNSPFAFASLTLGGRLGQYRYLDMDDAIDEALKLEIGE